MKRASDSTVTICFILFRLFDMLSVHIMCAGEFYRRRDPRDDGQEAEHPQHVRHRPRRPRQVHLDGLAGLQSRYHRQREGRRDSFHRHPQR